MSFPLAKLAHTSIFCRSTRKRNNGAAGVVENLGEFAFIAKAGDAGVHSRRRRRPSRPRHSSLLQHLLSAKLVLVLFARYCPVRRNLSAAAAAAAAILICSVCFALDRSEPSLSNRECDIPRRLMTTHDTVMTTPRTRQSRVRGHFAATAASVRVTT